MIPAICFRMSECPEVARVGRRDFRQRCPVVGPMRTLTDALARAPMTQSGPRAHRELRRTIMSQDAGRRRSVRRQHCPPPHYWVSAGTGAAPSRHSLRARPVASTGLQRALPKFDAPGSGSVAFDFSPGHRPFILSTVANAVLLTLGRDRDSGNHKQRRPISVT
jgi:hypothetical protein